MGSRHQARGSTPSIWFRVIAFAAAALLALGGLVTWWCDPLGLTCPTDQDLARLFGDNRAAFETLRRMANEDAETLHMVYFSGATLADSKLSESRREEYKRLMSQIAPRLAVAVYSRHEVTFLCAGGGMLLTVGASWMKGIKYMPDGDSMWGTVVATLDNERLYENGYFVRPLESNWVLVKESD